MKIRTRNITKHLKLKARPIRQLRVNNLLQTLLAVGSDFPTILNFNRNDTAFCSCTPPILVILRMRKAMGTQYRLQYRHVNGLESRTQRPVVFGAKAGMGTELCKSNCYSVMFCVTQLKAFLLVHRPVCVKKRYAVSTKLKF